MVKKLQALVATTRQFNNQIKALKTNLQHFHDATNGVSHYITDVNRAIDTWQFKSRPRLDRIRKISQRLTKLNRNQ